LVYLLEYMKMHGPRNIKFVLHISTLNIILKGNFIKLTKLIKLTETNSKRVHIVALESNRATNIITEIMHDLRILYNKSLYPQMF
jgi:hypothetical protein